MSQGRSSGGRGREGFDTPGEGGEGIKGLVRELALLERENELLKRRVTELSAYMHLAYRDALTGLRNRRYLEKRAAEEINRVRRDGDQTFSILVIDVDDFKQVNDWHGHATGDETLRWVARFLEGSVREHDVCCRYGGDEFVVILPQADAAACAQLVERLRARMSTVQEWAEVPLRLSVGAATYGVDGLSIAQLFDKADARMYEDKGVHKQRRASAIEARFVGESERLGWSRQLTQLAVANRPPLKQ